MRTPDFLIAAILTSLTVIPQKKDFPLAHLVFGKRISFFSVRVIGIIFNKRLAFIVLVPCVFYIKITLLAIDAIPLYRYQSLNEKSQYATFNS